MRRSGMLALILSVVLVLGLAPYLQALQKDNQEGQAAAVKAGTKLKAELESAVDTRTAKPGDEVTARVTKDVKQEGKTVVRKGDRLKGRITEVKAPQAKGEINAAESGSRLAVVFDRLVQGQSTSQLNVVLTTVLSTPSEQRALQEEPMLAAPSPAPAPAGSSASGNAGLLGGVSSTVGSVAGAGSTLGAATDTAFVATAGVVVATPAKAVRLDSQAQAQNQTGASSVLSTREGHLKLDLGTRLEFRVADQAENQAKTE